MYTNVSTFPSPFFLIFPFNFVILSTPVTSVRSVGVWGVQVLLYDWWLVRAEDKGLAVAGLASRE